MTDWIDVRELDRAATEALVDATPPRWVERGFLWDLSPDEKRRLDEVMEERAMPGAVRYQSRRRTPLDPPKEGADGAPRVEATISEAPAREPERTPAGRRPIRHHSSTASRIEAVLRADPRARYETIAERVGSSRGYVASIAREAGLQRGERGVPAWMGLDRQPMAQMGRRPKHDRDGDWSLDDETVPKTWRILRALRDDREASYRTVAERTKTTKSFVMATASKYDLRRQTGSREWTQDRQFAASEAAFARHNSPEGLERRAAREQTYVVRREGAAAQILAWVEAGRPRRDIAYELSIRDQDVAVVVREGKAAEERRKALLDWVPARDCTR